MIASLILIILLLSNIVFIIKLRDEGETLFMGVSLTLVFAFFCIMSVCIDINQYNKKYNQIKFMQPASIDIEKYNNAKSQLKEVQLLIQDVADKYKMQIEIKSLQGINVYSLPMSANTTTFQGLGDVERASGEKLKNLERLIDKQQKLASELINLYNNQYKPEYYTNLQELNTLRYNIFSGWFVRLFGITDKDTIVIQNQNVYPIK